MRVKDHKGQSVAEYAVVLALIAIVVTAVVIGISQRSRDRLANVNQGLDGDSGPAAAPASAGGSGGGSGKR